MSRYESPIRALGYADRFELRVDYLPDHPPDRIIHEIDPVASASTPSHRERDVRHQAS